MSIGACLVPIFTTFCSIISSWQRIGRVGRQERESLVVLIGMLDALDQYFLSNPDEFFSRSYERVVLDPANPVLASAHLVCAASELALTSADAATYGADVFRLIPDLVQRGRLLLDAAGDRWHSLRRAPQRDVKLRSMAGTYQIRDRACGRLMGTVDAVRTRLECHAGAIYLHGGRGYLVRELDIDRSLVHVEPAPGIDDFTVPHTEKETEIVERREHADHGSFRAGLGRIKVTTHFRGFVKKSLAHLAESTLGVSKSGDGLASLQWVREDRRDRVESYCRKDVELTARLYDHGRLHGHVLCKGRDGRTVRIPASWGPQASQAAGC